MSDPTSGAPPPADADAIEPCPEAERFQRDLYLYWQVVAASEGLPLSARGALTRAALRRVRARLAAAEGDQTAAEGAEAEDGRTLFLRRLLERLTLLKREEQASRLVAAPVTEMERFLSLSLGERLRACVKVWVAGGWWPDTPDPRAEPPRLMTPAPPRVALARRRLLGFLAASPGGEHPLPTLHTSTQPGGSRAKRSGTRSGSRANDTSVAGDEVTWHAALTGPLAWLGVVTPARVETPAEAGRARYHVTEAARALSADGDIPALCERQGRVTIQSDFSMVAYPPLHPRTLLALDRCADEVALERTARYTLSRASFTRARRAGLDAASVAALLRAQTGTPLPQPVAVALADWGRASDRITLHESVCLFEAPQPRLLDALLADRTGALWITRRLTPTAALVGREHVGRLRVWLLRHGEYPAVSLPLSATDTRENTERGEIT